MFLWFLVELSLVLILYPQFTIVVLLQDAGGGSTSSSPYHRQLTLNSESGASALDYDEVPITEQELSLDEKLGQIQFNISYDFQEMTLSVRIIRAINLPAKDFSGTSDPYVKVMLLPDKKTKLQTNIKRRNLNPRWNELFAFEGRFFVHEIGMCCCCEIEN